MSDIIPPAPPRATLGAMTLPAYLRGPALALACLALACVLCAAAAWAQAPDLAPAAAVAADECKREACAVG